MVFKMSRLAGGLTGVTALTLACGGVPSDRAGGAANVDAVVLTMAQNSDAPPLWPQEWADDVAAQSGGSLQIEFANSWRLGEPEYETATIEDVQAGDVDLAYVGLRAFDRVGVTSFQPLMAPLLIDSHDLQMAVFDAGIPEEMLAGLDAIDLAGIGVLPGPMRKVLGVSHPFVAPADFAGQLVGIQDSAIAEQTMLALGATSDNMPIGADIAGLDGYEQQLGSIASNDYWRDAQYVTANVNLWPRPLVLFVNAERLASLSADQQRIMHDAAATIANEQRAQVRDEDAGAVAYLCDQAMTLTLATDDDLASLRSAVQPVYDEIASDPDNAAWLNQIEELKVEVDAPVASTECPQTDATAEIETGAFPDGTFAMTATDEDFEQVCGGAIDDFEQTTYAVFEDGRVQHLQPQPNGTVDIGFKATYTVVRDRVEILEVGTSAPLVFHWTFDGTELVLSDLADDFGDCTHHGAWESHPWVLTTDDAIPTSETSEAR